MLAGLFLGAALGFILAHIFYGLELNRIQNNYNKSVESLIDSYEEEVHQMRMIHWKNKFNETNSQVN